jgi:hypothetical protein
MGKLGKLVYHPEEGVQETQTKLKGLIAQLSEEGLSHGAAYLAAAAPYTLTYREHPDGMFFDNKRLEPLAISSTSPAERQMREINRRTDVGARWSVSGVENLISLDLTRRFDPEQWRTLWRLPEHPLHDCSIVKLQVSAEAEPPPNVKTS